MSTRLKDMSLVQQRNDSLYIYTYTYLVVVYIPSGNLT